jgi:hypothetical protein
MSRLKTWLVNKYLQLEQQAVEAIGTANFYGNLFTQRQKFHIVVFFMALFAFSGLQGAVHFVALVYIMSKMTPPDNDDKQE